MTTDEDKPELADENEDEDTWEPKEAFVEGIHQKYGSSGVFDFEAYYNGPEYQKVLDDFDLQYSRINTPFWYWLGRKIEKLKRK